MTPTNKLSSLRPSLTNRGPLYLIIVSTCLSVAGCSEEIGTDIGHLGTRTVEIRAEELLDGQRITVTGAAVKLLACDADQDGRCSFEQRGHDLRFSLVHLQGGPTHAGTFEKLNQYRAEVRLEAMASGIPSDLCTQVLDQSVDHPPGEWIPASGDTQCSLEMLGDEDSDGGVVSVYTPRLKLRLASAPTTTTRLVLRSNSDERHVLKDGDVSRTSARLFMHGHVRSLCFDGETSEVEAILEHVAELARAGDDEMAPGELTLSYSAAAERFTGEIFWRDIFSGFFDTYFDLDFGRCP